MYYRLKKNYRLRGWELLPYALVDMNTRRPLFIRPEEMDALKLCNGRIDLEIPLISDEIRKMIPQIEKNGIIEPCQQGDGILPEQEYKKYPARYIRTAHWSITGRCNFRCRHCYMSAPDAKLGELSHEQIMRMVEELAQCGIMNVSLTGGEPLVRSDFLEIVDALLEREIRITQIYSNGALVNEKLLTELDARGIHPEFNMSFDGVGWHDWLRSIPGAESMVDRAFRLCREMGFPTGAEMCIHNDNKDTLRDSILHLHEVGCSSLKTNPISDVGEWKKQGFGASISTDEMFRLYMDYIPKYYEDGMPLSLMLGGFFHADPKRPDHWDIPLYHYPKDPEKCCVCNHARMVMYISPEGRALPCLSLSGMDIQEQFPLIPELGLAKCITESFYMNFINTRADKVLAHNPECGECIWARWCQGGCRAAGLDDSGQTDLLNRDPASCAIFAGGWGAKLVRLMKELRPDDHSPVLADEKLMEMLERQEED